MSNCRLANA